MWHHLICLSWGCVWWAPYVTVVSNNVIRTIIIKHDIPFILEYYWDQNTSLKLSLIFGFAVIPTGMKCSTVAECSKKTHFIPPITARPWLHSLRWRRGSGQPTSWLAARPPNGGGGPRCGCLKASSRLQLSNMSKRKMGTKWPYEFLILQERLSILLSSMLVVGYILYTLTVKQYQENKGQIIVNYLDAK